MTRNEKIAEKLQFKLIPNAYKFNDISHWGYVDKNGALVCTKEFDPEHNLNHAKLLQQRMVEDWWEIYLSQIKQSFHARAIEPLRPFRTFKKEIVASGKSESAAIVELFCRVNGIE